LVAAKGRAVLIRGLTSFGGGLKEAPKAWRKLATRKKISLTSLILLDDRRQKLGKCDIYI